MICEIALKLDPSSLDHIYKLISRITPDKLNEVSIKLIQEISFNAIISLNRDNGKFYRIF